MMIFAERQVGACVAPRDGVPLEGLPDLRARQALCRPGRAGGEQGKTGEDASGGGRLHRRASRRLIGAAGTCEIRPSQYQGLPLSVWLRGLPISTLASALTMPLPLLRST